MYYSVEWGIDNSTVIRTGMDPVFYYPDIRSQ